MLRSNSTLSNAQSAATRSSSFLRVGPSAGATVAMGNGALASVPLSTILPGPDPSPRDDGGHSGILIIPIDEDPIYELSASELVDADEADEADEAE